MNVIDEEIIEKCLAGDLSDFALLYDKYLGKIHNYIYYRVQQKETAEDLTSLTFVKALENIGSFKLKRGTFSAWLYRIAKNIIFDHYRSLKPQSNIDDIWDLSSHEDVQKDVGIKMELEKVSEILKTLKPDQRELVIMRLWDGLSYQEISEILGKNENSLKVAFSRALSKIKDSEILLLLALIPFIHG